MAHDKPNVEELMANLDASVKKARAARDNGRLKPVSDKRRARAATMQAARAEAEARAYGRCEANTPACPSREHRADHAHHMLRRAQGGRDVPENLLMVCEASHRWIHANPSEAYENGWLIRGNGPNHGSEKGVR